jgi:DNA repair exonuclease SbcCD ATPase subunit
MSEPLNLDVLNGPIHERKEPEQPETIEDLKKQLAAEKEAHAKEKRISLDRFHKWQEEVKNMRIAEQQRNHYFDAYNNIRIKADRMEYILEAERAQHAETKAKLGEVENMPNDEAIAHAKTKNALQTTHAGLQQELAELARERAEHQKTKLALAEAEKVKDAVIANYHQHQSHFDRSKHDTGYLSNQVALKQTEIIRLQAQLQYILKNGVPNQGQNGAHTVNEFDKQKIKDEAAKAVQEINAKYHDAKMKHLQAANEAATAKADLEEAKNKIAGLEKEVENLKKEVADLQEQLAQRPVPTREETPVQTEPQVQHTPQARKRKAVDALVDVTTNRLM